MTDPTAPQNDAAVDDAMAQDDQDLARRELQEDGSILVYDDEGALVERIPPRPAMESRDSIGSPDEPA